MIQENKVKTKKANTRKQSSKHGRFMSAEQAAHEDPSTVQTVGINRDPSVPKAVKAYMEGRYHGVNSTDGIIFYRDDITDLLISFGNVLLDK